MRIAVLLIALGLLFIGTDTQARKREGGLAVIVGGGFPASPGAFRDGWKTGITGGGRLGFSWRPAITPYLAAEYSRFGLDASSFDFSTEPEGGTVSILMLSGGVQYAPWGSKESGLDPYLLGGIGFYQIALGDFKVLGAPPPAGIPDREDAIAVQVGAGAQSSHAILEVILTIGFTNDNSTGHVAVRLGIFMPQSKGKG